MNFCKQDGHTESKIFKKMEALEVEMKKNAMSLDLSYSNSSFHMHALFTSSFYLNAASTSSNEWFIDF